MAPIRATEDVDVGIVAENYADFAGIEEKLREAGFEHSVSADPPGFRKNKRG